MNEAFFFVYWVHQLNGSGCDGETYGTAELLRQMQSDPHFLVSQKAFWEHVWRTTGRHETAALIRSLVGAARYLSDLVQDDVPFLASRDVVEASAGVTRSAPADTLLIGRAVQRAIDAQVGRQTEQATESMLAQIQQFMSNQVGPAVPPESRFLDSKQIAVRLGLSEITVARLCGRGQIDADKTRGNQWRTTEERLRRSPYLNAKRRRGGRHAPLE